MKQDEQKAVVAIAALDFVVADTLIGVGTGSTANLFIDALATCPRKPRAAVASSEASRERLQRHGIEVIELNELDESGLEVYIDGADEIDTRLRMIKGGGGALTREKIVAAAAKRFVCIADASKWVSRLGRFPLPVEVLPMARVQIMRVLARLGGRPVWRENVITDNGGQIIDVHDLPIDEPAVLEGEINQLPGVVCNGLFARRAADILLLGTDQGVKIIEPATDD